MIQQKNILTNEFYAVYRNKIKPKQMLIAKKLKASKSPSFMCINNEK